MKAHVNIRPNSETNAIIFSFFTSANEVKDKQGSDVHNIYSDPGPVIRED